MISIIRNIFISIGVGFLLYELQNAMQSSYVVTFLKANLVTLLVALVAINSATLGIILTKIRDILDKEGNNGNFIQTKKQMILSIKEQISIIPISLILLLIEDSVWINNHNNCSSFIEVMLIACFFYAIIILYDTAKSVFVILDYDEE